MALVHAKEITPYAEIDPAVRELCDDLVFNRRPDALSRFIEHFESAVVQAAQDDAANAEADLPIEQQIHNAILRRRKDGIEAKIDEALQSAYAGRRAQRDSLAGDEGRRRQVRRRRADSAVRVCSRPK